MIHFCFNHFKYEMPIQHLRKDDKVAIRHNSMSERMKLFLEKTVKCICKTMGLHSIS